MANTAYVITDGSLDPVSKVGGVAGKIVVDGVDEVIDFSLPIINAKDSTTVEYLAIAEAVKLLGKMRFQVNSPFKFDNVVFATDSLSLMCAVDPEQVREKFPKAAGFVKSDGARYSKLAKALDANTQGIGVTYSMTKVKAHVENYEASSLERLHNQVDLMAVVEKNSILEKINKQALSKAHNIYSVMIPSKLSDEGYSKIKDAVTNLLSKGMAARVLIEKGAKNPVLEAYNDFKASNSLTHKEVKFLLPRVYQAAELNSNEQTSKLKGLNRARARMWLKTEDELVDEWVLNGDTGSIMGDVIASTLGNSLSGHALAKSGFNGAVTAKPVEFILHHGEEIKMPDHYSMINRAVKTFTLERKCIDTILACDLQKEDEMTIGM